VELRNLRELSVNCQTVSMNDVTRSTSTTGVFGDTLAYVTAHAGVLELWGISSCSQLPASSARFRDEVLLEYTLSQPKNEINSYGEWLGNPVWYNAHGALGSPSCSQNDTSWVTTGTWSWDNRSFATLTW
jgi:hypothetical protein